MQGTGLQNPGSRFKIFLKDRPAPVVLMLGLGVESRQSGGRPGENPFWAALSQEDGAILPAIIRGESYSALKRGGEYFKKAQQ